MLIPAVLEVQGFPLVTTVVVSQEPSALAQNPLCPCPRVGAGTGLAALGRAGFLPLQCPGKQIGFREWKREIRSAWNTKEIIPACAHGLTKPSSRAESQLLSPKSVRHHWIYPVLIAIPSPGGCFRGKSLVCKPFESFVRWGAQQQGISKKSKRNQSPAPQLAIHGQEKTPASWQLKNTSELLFAGRCLGIIAWWPGDLLYSPKRHNENSLLTRAAKELKKGRGST